MCWLCYGNLIGFQNVKKNLKFERAWALQYMRRATLVQYVMVKQAHMVKYKSQIQSQKQTEFT